MKKTYFLLVTLFGFFTSMAQITLDQGDFPIAGFNKDYYEADGDSVEVGNTGANQTFNFSDILNQVYDTFNIEFVTPSSTGFAANHPTATVAILTEYEEDSATQQTILEIWEFLTVGAQGAVFTGTTIRVDTGVMFSESPPTSMVDIHAEYQPGLKFIGTSDSYPSSSTNMGAWSATIGKLKHDFIVTREVEVDAYGKFENPWTEFDALRLKVFEVSSGIDTVDGQLDDSYSDTMHYFEYWTKDFGYFLGRAYMDDTYSMVYGVEIADQRSQVGIETPKPLSENKLYPNPTISLLNVVVQDQSVNQYKILDINGKLVMTGLAHSSLGQLGIDVSELKSGIYVLELLSEKGLISTQKFIVKK